MDFLKQPVFVNLTSPDYRIFLVRPKYSITARISDSTSATGWAQMSPVSWNNDPRMNIADLQITILFHHQKIQEPLIVYYHL